MSFKSSFLIGAVMLSGPVFLQIPAAVAADPASSEMPKQEQHAVDNAQLPQVALQIQELHDKLKITSAQEKQWSDVAEAMRDTSKEVRTKLTDRAETTKMGRPTAVDELRAYRDLQQVQYDGVKRLIEPFEGLYASMSSEQKSNADELFERPRVEAEASGAGRHHPSN